MTERCYDPRHRSYSSDQTFDGCQYRWHAEYDLGLREAPNDRLLIGEVVDQAVMAQLSGTEVRSPGFIELALREAFTRNSKLVLKEAHIEKAVRLYELWRDVVLPTYPEVQAVQPEIHVEIAGLTYHFHPDIVFADSGVVDVKTSERRLGDRRAADDVQLTTYAYGLWRKYGLIPSWVGLDGLIYANPPSEIVVEAEMLGLRKPTKPWWDRQRSTRNLVQLRALEDEVRRREAARRFARTAGIYQTNGRVRRGECDGCPAQSICPSWAGFDIQREVIIDVA